MSDTVIRVENLSKRYVLGAKESLPKTRRETMANIIGAPMKYVRSMFGESKQEEAFWALKDVSFEVKAGEVVGVIGRNGAGKSTLLKILSRITKPSSGHVEIRGRVGSLLEVGTGFHPELTGRENIYLNGAILGMRRWEIDKKFDEIVAFAEIERFLDTPVKRYSSGMYVRLAFAVAAHLEPEILVVDEVLAVGDAEFQKKCLGKMEDVAAKEGRTVLFVSHNMGAIKKLCMRSLLISQGKLQYYTDTDTVIKHYFSDDQGSEGYIEWEQNEAPRSPNFRFTKAYILDKDKEITSSIDCCQPFSIVVEYEILTPLNGVRVGFALQNSEGIMLCGSNDPDAWNKPSEQFGHYRIECKFPEYTFNTGKYYVRFGCDKYPFDRVLVATPYCLKFMIEDTQGHGIMKEKLPGIIRPQLKWVTKNLSVI
jgi:lipopolysaccharide transport system ATP-binding protein